MTQSGVECLGNDFKFMRDFSLLIISHWYTANYVDALFESNRKNTYKYILCAIHSDTLEH